MNRVRLAVAVALAAMGFLSGCAVLPGGSSTPSVATPSDSSSSDYGKQAVCALGSAGISLIRAGGAGSKALAQLIADNAQDQKVKDMANAVLNSTAGEDVRNQLADWLTSYCGS
ncbi:MAG: hypothetical protein FWD63_04835 [Propionibacteriaceae bacterium]|nr:hypothetical protein [Propionibacteriaceae bacterium]